MRLPEEVTRPLDEFLEQRDLGRVRAVEPVGGGCITETARVRTSREDDFFLKWATGSRHPAGLFSSEAESLQAIGATGAIRVPELVDVRDTDVDRSVDAEDIGPRWLLLEWLAPRASAPHTWAALGQALVHMHRVRDDRAGWTRDNFIGTLPQPNNRKDDWPTFWREHRLLPQLERATSAGLLSTADRAHFDKLIGRLDELLAPAAADGFSLLHGDLWSGNVHIIEPGDAALIDPAAYHGHREVDLAMSELFGGFDPIFHAAYHEAWPLQPGYERSRRAIYQIYYLLVHVNLFGAGYRARTLSALASLGL